MSEINKIIPMLLVAALGAVDDGTEIVDPKEGMESVGSSGSPSKKRQRTDDFVETQSLIAFSSREYKDALGFLLRKAKDGKKEILVGWENRDASEAVFPDTNLLPLYHWSDIKNEKVFFDPEHNIIRFRLKPGMFYGDNYNFTPLGSYEAFCALASKKGRLAFKFDPTIGQCIQFIPGESENMIVFGAKADAKNVIDLIYADREHVRFGDYFFDRESGCVEYGELSHERCVSFVPIAKRMLGMYDVHNADQRMG